MRLRHPKIGLVLSLLVAACAQKQQVDPAARVDKLTRDELRYQAIRVEPFTISPKGVKEKDPEAYLRKAHETCLRVLTRSGLFDTVSAEAGGEPSDATLVVRGELTALRVVTSGQEQWMGVLAGRSVMKVRVTLADAQTGKVLRSVLVEQDGDTAGGPWSFGATDRSLPAEVGTRIAEVAAAAGTK